MKLFLGSQQVADFAGLVGAISIETLNSPQRSVVPLLDFFRHPERALSTLGDAIQLPLNDTSQLVFESQVPVQKGKGKASFTDLLVLSPTAAVTIEAKYKEPRYETVARWLVPRPRDRGVEPAAESPNRNAVLRGWLSLLGDRSGRPISREHVTSLPYQLVHRAASAAAVEAKRRALLYLIFGESRSDHYVKDVRELDALLGYPDALEMHVVRVPLHGSAEFAALVARWNLGERALATDVQLALNRGELFSFGKPEVLYSGGRGKHHTTAR